MKHFFGREVIESERRGSSNRSAKARKFGRIVPDEESGFEYYGETKIPSAKDGRAHFYHKRRGGKDFTDVLGPIKGYLRKNCGRPWNDLYSELTKELGRGTWPLRHILTEHVDVAAKTYRGVDGKIWHCDRHGVHAIDRGFRVDEFYVEPETGLLRAITNRPRWRFKAEPARKETDRVPLDGERWGVRVEGLWYIGTYREVLAADPQFSGERVSVFTKIKQANGKEIRLIQGTLTSMITRRI